MSDIRDGVNQLVNNDSALDPVGLLHLLRLFMSPGSGPVVEQNSDGPAIYMEELAQEQTEPAISCQASLADDSKRVMEWESTPIVEKNDRRSLQFEDVCTEHASVTENSINVGHFVAPANRELAGCTLWDLSINEAAANLLLSNLALSVFETVLLQEMSKGGLFTSLRVVELTIGILANLASHTSTVGSVINSIGLNELLIGKEGVFFVLDDAACLSELCRLLVAAINRDALSDHIFSSLSSVSFAQRLRALCSNTLNATLLERLLALIAELLGLKDPGSSLTAALASAGIGLELASILEIAAAQIFKERAQDQDWASSPSRTPADEEGGCYDESAHNEVELPTVHVSKDALIDALRSVLLLSTNVESSAVEFDACLSQLRSALMKLFRACCRGGVEDSGHEQELELALSVLATLAAKESENNRGLAKFQAQAEELEVGIRKAEQCNLDRSDLDLGSSRRDQSELDTESNKPDQPKVDMDHSKPDLCELDPASKGLDHCKIEVGINRLDQCELDLRLKRPDKSEFDVGSSEPELALHTESNRPVFEEGTEAVETSDMGQPHEHGYTHVNSSATVEGSSAKASYKMEGTRMLQETAEKLHLEVEGVGQEEAGILMPGDAVTRQQALEPRTVGEYLAEDIKNLVYLSEVASTVCSYDEDSSTLEAAWYLLACASKAIVLRIQALVSSPQSTAAYADLGSPSQNLGPVRQATDMGRDSAKPDGLTPATVFTADPIDKERNGAKPDGQTVASATTEEPVQAVKRGYAMAERQSNKRHKPLSGSQMKALLKLLKVLAKTRVIDDVKKSAIVCMTNLALAMKHILEWSREGSALEAVKSTKAHKCEGGQQLIDMDRMEKSLYALKVRLEALHPSVDRT